MERSKPAVLLLLANGLTLAVLALMPLSGGPPFLRDCAALIAMFFVPGTALALSFSKRERMPLFELLALGFAINIILWTAATTVIKLAGAGLDRGTLCAVAAYGVVVSLLMFLRSRRLPVVYNDLRVPLPMLCAAIVSFPLLFYSLRGYTLRGPEAHWLVEQVRELHAPPPGEGEPIGARHYLGAGVSRDGDYLTLARGSSRMMLTNPSRRHAIARLGYLVAADSPGMFTIAARGKTYRYPLPQPFFETGREVRFQNQAVVTAALDLPPGETVVALEFMDRAGKAARCTLLDGTGLTDRQFRDAFNRRYRLVNYVLMYDSMESKDFIANLLYKPYIYHSPGTPEMPGYAVTNPPMSYIFTSFGYLLMGGTMAAINKVAFALSMAQFFAALFLMHRGLEKTNAAASAALLLGTLSLVTLLTMGISLHFMTHFMFLCFLLACAFLLQRKAFLFLVFALLCCGSAWAGYYFCALGLLCYGILWREIGWPLRRLATLTLCMGACVALLLVVGRARGMLPAWMDTLLWENFRRFGTAHIYQAGSKLKFLACCIPGTALLPLGVLLRRDKSVYLFLLFSGIYAATLLLAPSNEWKIHYLPTLCLPLMIAGGRSLALAGAEDVRRGRPYLWGTAIILAGAAGGFVYLLILSSRGVLL